MNMITEYPKQLAAFPREGRVEGDLSVSSLRVWLRLGFVLASSGFVWLRLALAWLRLVSSGAGLVPGFGK